jgi:fatty-acyl-CoA synthase
MMNYPLLITSFMQHVAKYFAKKEIVSVYPGGSFRYTYAQWYRRTCQLAHALKKFGIKRGERVASFSLNNQRHFELYFGVPSMGAILHTVNIRLSQEHLVYIINHAGDRILFLDEDVYFLIEPVMDKLKTVELYVILSQTNVMPQTKLAPVVLYDEWIKGHPEEYDFPYDRDENEAALICYTSATTGDPKGVVYSHRGIVLHTLAGGLTLGVREDDCILLVVPMFHANAWGAPFMSCIGLKQVLPGRQLLDMGAICKIIADEKVTVTYGVPTIWMMLYKYLEDGGAYDFSSLRMVYSGGAAMPRHLMESFSRKYNFNITQAYGMTETSPLATAAIPKSYMVGLPDKELYDIKTTAGHPVNLVDMKLINMDTGKEAKMDGIEMGEICLRGPWIASEYYKDPERSKAFFKDGWLHTGDIGTMNEEGYVSLVDRTKDLIKSAGEWISSVDLENALMGPPGVLEAAVIGMPDEKWQERPLACVVLNPATSESVTKEDILNFLKDKVAKWWLPDEVVFIKEIPKTSVGKFNKKELRKTVLPEVIKSRSA